MIRITAFRKLALLALALGAVVLLAGCSGRTTGATSITTNSAQLNSIGSCDQGNCSAYFRWRAVGTTTWTNAPTINNIGAVSNIAWAQIATGLTPGTQYEYQACGREAYFGPNIFVCSGPDGLTTSTQAFSTLPPPDTTPPAVTLTQPPDGSTTTNPRPPLSGAAGDAVGDGATVTVKIYAGADTSGTLVESIDTARSGSSWSAAPTADLALGTYTARAEQSDNAGNLGQSAPSTFTFDADTTPPAVTLTQPPDGSTTTNPRPPLSGAAGDAVGDGATVTVKIYSGSSATGTPVQVINTTRSATSWSTTPTADLAPGTYTARAEQSDLSGNQGQSGTSTFTIEPPPNPGPKLRRYPYLTDVVGTSATLNWATDRSATTGVLKWGTDSGGSCTPNTVTASRINITVNGVPEYQWKASISGLSPDTRYCYRVFLGSSPQVDLLGGGTLRFSSQLAAGSSTPFSFAVFGDWGKVGASGNPDQANVMQQIASSGARFAVTTGDNAYESGSQTNYGDLQQSGAGISAVFGGSFWKVPGASMPIFPTIGNHGFESTTHRDNWPQSSAVSGSGGTYAAGPARYWYAFEAGGARFYVLEAASSTGSTAYQSDYNAHWTPSSAEYQWLEADLASHPTQLKFAFFHYPMYSDQASESSSTFLRGANSLEGLLAAGGVDVAFSGHAHIYQRNLDPGTGGVISYLTGGGGADPKPIGENGCSSIDAYGIGWSTTTNQGSRCAAAPVPTSKAQVFHFLKVSVDGTSVTVTPTNSLGNSFDVQTYDFAP